MNLILENKLKEVIATAIIHRQRLIDSHKLILSWNHTLDKDSFNSLTIEQIAITDQFVFRFAKLQDLMGEKLFKLVLEYVGEYTERLSQIEILNKLEKLEAIQSADLWLELRYERNKIAHDYAKMIEDVLEDLSVLLSKKQLLLDYLEDIVFYLEKNGFKH